MSYDPEQHEAFLFNSWLESYRSSDSARNVATDIYMGHHHRLIESLLEDSDNLTAVAVDLDDPDQYYGWAMGTHRGPALVLHYVYVKSSFRRFGLARLLVEHLAWRREGETHIFFATHQTHTGRGIIRHRPDWHYHPYLLSGSLL
ncbi:MAG: GNAT family N-acetyltransferase [Anaerolineae bacterium]|nr:GNAT family N-acetyltransferase [Anaerolineae bacterium]